jgi:hypothetical protein
MKIQPQSSPPHSRLSLGKWFRAHKPADRTLLVWVLVIVLASAAGIWYQMAGKSLLAPFVSSLFASNSEEDANGLPAFYLSIPPEAYQVLNRQWREALQKGILHLDDGQWLPAQARFREEAMPVRIWLEWEQADHRQESRWPLQVKIENEATILGMRSFSAQPPTTDRCLDEWLYAQELRRADVLAPRYVFVHLVVNGDDWGPYALREDLSHEWLDSQRRQGGVIVQLKDSLFWERWPLSDDVEVPYWNVFTEPMAVASDLPAFATVDELSAGDDRGDGTLSDQAVTALGLLRAFQSQALPTATVFDAERLGRYIAHANLWGARQGTIGHDERYYYNPSTSQLEPVAADRFASTPRVAHLTDLAQYDDPEVMRAFVREVLSISRPGYLDELRTRYGEDIERIYAALAQELPATELALPWDVLAERQVSLLSSLHPPQTVHAYQSSDDSLDDRERAVVLHVGNLCRYPVVLQRLQSGEHAIEVRPDWVTPADAGLLHDPSGPHVVLRRAMGAIPQYVVLRVPITAIQALRAQGASLEPGTLQLVTSLVGMDESVVVDVQPDYPAALSAAALPAPPSVQEALERYPFLAMGDRPGFLELRPGTWVVDGDLVLPAGIGLQATQAVTLTFDPGALFLSSGPLLLHGPQQGGIHFVPKQQEWAGIAVIRTGSHVASSLAHVEIRGTTGIRREGWVTGGGITFYESASVLQHCRLLDSTAPATLRVVRAHFEFTDTEFANAAQTALVSDFAEGRMEGCAFHDIIGRAIDAHGSQIAMQGVSLTRVYDTGILASRESVVVIQTLRATDVGIAIASEDMSYVRAQDVYVLRASRADFAAYMGENGYGPAVIQASQVVFGEDESTHALVQQGSSITLNGIDMVARETEEDDRGETWQVTRVLNYRLGPTIRLIGYDLSPTQLAPGDTCELVLYWQALARPPLDYTIFVHLLDAQGQYVTGWDTMPRDNAFPTAGWPVRTTVDDLHRLALPADLPPGTYQISLGMYYWPTQERLPVYGPGGDDIPDARIVLDHKIEVR